MMELVLVKREENSLRVRVIGEDHTLLNLLSKSLYEDKKVAAAPYRIEHPLLGHMELYLKVKQGTPERALVRAAERVAERCKQLQRGLREALKGR